MQVSFVPKDESELLPESTASVEINGKTHSIYVHSYLCLGKAEFTRRYRAKLIKVISFKIYVEMLTYIVIKLTVKD